MELIFAALAGILIGLGAWALARPRTAIGSALLPAVGGITALAWWILATWGAKLLSMEWLQYGAPWIWIILAILTAAVCLPIALVLPRRRAEADADLLERLSHRSITHA